MFELRPIRACAKFESVKEPEAEIPSVELIAELVEVELQELGLYVMGGVEHTSRGVADGNVHPRQDFPDTLFVVRNEGMVRGCRPILFKGGIAAEPVRSHIGIPVRFSFNLVGNGGSFEITDNLHLYMSDSLGRTVLLGRKRLGQASSRCIIKCILTINSLRSKR